VRSARLAQAEAIFFRFIARLTVIMLSFDIEFIVKNTSADAISNAGSICLFLSDKGRRKHNANNKYPNMLS
jgi:hypothetical protein